MRLFFNDNEPYVTQWLHNIWPDAQVDTRSIADIKAVDVKGYERVHLFAGIGGWEYALLLADWPEEVPVWTGSCPCQPFSFAGRQMGEEDERNLWPEMLRLIAECRPPVVFGEQVENILGRQWLARVRADLEALGYGVGAADLCAAGVGAPHIRQRLYWVAIAKSEQPYRDRYAWGESADGGGLGNANGKGSQGQLIRGDSSNKWLAGAASMGAWNDYELVYCSDGRQRRIEPRSFPLAYGIPNRVGRIRAYGNGIVPQVAAVFIKAFLDTVRRS